MMWPLLAASIVTIAIAVERTVFYRRSASDMQVLQGEFLSAVRAKILMLQPHFAKKQEAPSVQFLKRPLQSAMP